MSAFQWLISQQDNYNGGSNLVNEFIADLYLNFNSQKFCYILHDKESDLHIHCILRLDYSMSKKQLLQIFPNADIKLQGSTNRNAWLYLGHQTERAIKENKTKYDLETIIYNNFDDLEQWLNFEKEKKQKNKNDIDLLDLIVDDILNGTVTCFKDVLYKYKGVALKYSRSIQELFDNFKL